MKLDEEKETRKKLYLLKTELELFLKQETSLLDQLSVDKKKMSSELSMLGARESRAMMVLSLPIDSMNEEELLVEDAELLAEQYEQRFIDSEPIPSYVDFNIDELIERNKERRYKLQKRQEKIIEKRKAPSIPKSAKKLKPRSIIEPFEYSSDKVNTIISRLEEQSRKIEAINLQSAEMQNRNEIERKNKTEELNEKLSWIDLLSEYLQSLEQNKESKQLLSQLQLEYATLLRQRTTIARDKSKNQSDIHSNQKKESYIQIRKNELAQNEIALKEARLRLKMLQEENAKKEEFYYSELKRVEAIEEEIRIIEQKSKSVLGDLHHETESISQIISSISK